MSLTCSFRSFADQVRHHLVGGRRRASSNNDCRELWDINCENKLHHKRASCQHRSSPCTPAPSTTHIPDHRSVCDSRTTENSQRKAPCRSVKLGEVRFQAGSRTKGRSLSEDASQRDCRKTYEDGALRSPQQLNSTHGIIQIGSNDKIKRSQSGKVLEVTNISGVMGHRYAPSTSKEINPEVKSLITGANANESVIDFGRSGCGVPSMSTSVVSTTSSSICSQPGAQSGGAIHVTFRHTDTSGKSHKPNNNRSSNMSTDTSFAECELRSFSLGSPVPCYYPHQSTHPHRSFDLEGNSISDYRQLIGSQPWCQSMIVSQSGAGTNEACTSDFSLINSPVREAQQRQDSASSPAVRATLTARCKASSLSSFNQTYLETPSPRRNRKRSTAFLGNLAGTPETNLSATNSTCYLRVPSRSQLVQGVENALTDEPPVLPARTSSLGCRITESCMPRLSPQPSTSQTHCPSENLSTGLEAAEQMNGSSKPVHPRAHSDTLEVKGRHQSSLPNSPIPSLQLSTLSCRSPVVLPSDSESLTVTRTGGGYKDESCRSVPALPSLPYNQNLVVAKQPTDQSASLNNIPYRQAQHGLGTARQLPSSKYSLGMGNVPSSPSCGALEELMPMNHASRLLGRMSNKLRDGRLADVILLAGSRLVSGNPTGDTANPEETGSRNEVYTPTVRIPAHRVILAAASDYFSAMFGNEVKEATATEIWIRDVEPNALQKLIDYIYTGHLDLREDTVEDILGAACFLQIIEASQACEKYLIKRLHPSNCLGMARLGEQHGCHLLHKKSTRYILENFTEVVQQPEFLHLTINELACLLSSDHLRVPNEATVFAACLRWARNDSDSRRSKQFPSSLVYLLSFVRLKQLPARLLTDAIEKEPLFHDDMDAVRLLVSALRSHFTPEQAQMDLGGAMHFEKEWNSTPFLVKFHEDSRPVAVSKAGRFQGNCLLASSDLASVAKTGLNPKIRHYPRPSTVGHIWALGGKTMTTTRALQEILEYDPYSNSWRIVGQLPGQRQQCGCILLDGDRLLVVGGRDELKTLSTVECIYLDEISRNIGARMTRSVSGRSGDRTSGQNRGNNALSTALRHSQHRTNVGEQDMTLLTRSVVGTVPDGSAVDAQSLNSNLLMAEQNGEQHSGWHIVSAMATHRHGLGVAVLEGVVYAVGGHDGWSYLNTVERWNGRAKAWSPVSPMAVQRSTVGVAALDGLLYAVGGRDGSACLRTVERFNPHTQHWCFIAPMLHRRGGVGVGAVGGRLYAVGGHNAPPSQPHALRTASVEMYEPRTDMWTEVACLSSPRDSIAVTILGAKLYALGGHDGQAYTDQVQVYDPEKNQWAEVAPLPSGRAGVAVASSSDVFSSALTRSKLPYYKADPLA